jgi:hypothetical protein
VLDQVAWGQTFIDAGYAVPKDDGSERGGVPILTEESAPRALSAIDDKRLSEAQLRNALRDQSPIRNWEQVAHLFPAVLIDFDHRRLISMYSEPLELERYVPSGWQGEYRSLFDEIPVQHRYWIDGSRNYLNDALTV